MKFKIWTLEISLTDNDVKLLLENKLSDETNEKFLLSIFPKIITNLIDGLLHYLLNLGKKVFDFVKTYKTLFVCLSSLYIFVVCYKANHLNLLNLIVACILIFFSLDTKHD